MHIRLPTTSLAHLQGLLIPIIVLALYVFPTHHILLILLLFASDPHPVSSSKMPPVTRIASFKFRPTTTSAQKSDRAQTFRNLYAQHPHLVIEQPKGGKSLRTPLKFDDTGVQGQLEWDMCFVAVFKVCYNLVLPIWGSGVRKG